MSSRILSVASNDTCIPLFDRMILDDSEEELGDSDKDSDDEIVAQRATLSNDPLMDTTTEDE